jgi:hypothetical protein
MLSLTNFFYLTRRVLLVDDTAANAMTGDYSLQRNGSKTLLKIRTQRETISGAND